MTSFKFPPPPPPPPKASSSNDTPQPYASQRGGHNRGRGDGARGRGGGQGRGGGSQNFGENTRGGHGQSNPRGAMNGRGGPRGGGYQRGGPKLGYGQQQNHQPSPITPSRAYVNPSFMTQGQSRGPQPQVDPNALVQAMSFMATPAGQQSMAAFANHMAGVGSAAPQYSQSSSPQYASSAPRYSPAQHAGQKRKLNDRNNGQSQPPRKPPQPSPKPPRAKAAVPPPVPSFGFSLPKPVVQPVIRSKAKGKNDTQKRKVNLGLTQHPMPELESEEEDVDEEVEYAKTLKGGGFAFEHEGELISIRTAAEVAAWIKDRRRQFPTQQRIMQKAEENALKRAAELDFLRKLKGRPPKSDTAIRTHAPEKVREESKVNNKGREEEVRRQEELAVLRRKLHESMLKKQGKSSTVDLGLGYDSETESEDESSILSESSVVSSSEESSEESDDESDESEQAPEPISSKVGPSPIKVPPAAPPPSLPPSTQAKRIICPSWERNGRCRYSNKCNFAHPRKEEKRMGLYDMMVEQELVKADELALETIKYLGQHGFLG